MTASLLRSRRFFSVLSTNAVVWIISIRPSISNTSSLLSRPLETIPSAPITMSITDILMFKNYFRSLARFKYFSLCSFSLIFTLWSAWLRDFPCLSLEKTIQYYSSNFCFLVNVSYHPFDVSVISGRCNQSFFSLFNVWYVLFVYWCYLQCWRVLFLLLFLA